jgi:hypothetical protein
MNAQVVYPLFSPPNELASKDKKLWTMAESRAYLEWLKSVVDQRANSFLAYLNCVNLPLIEQSLDLIDARFCDALSEPQFRNESGSAPLKLSNYGYAIAADWGLTLSSTIIKASGDTTYWETLRSPKSDASYNLPVLMRGAEIPMEPIGVGIARATSLIRGRLPKHSARAIYQSWFGL